MAWSGLLISLLLLLVLTACTPSRDRYTAMRTALDSINVLNRTDQPFTVADVQPYVDYFDRYGNSNDRLLAHYLLGRAYHEQGEAPMALQCYQQAADCADTTATDCDYKQLCRVYSQMSEIFYNQSLYREQLKYVRISMKYAWQAKDTLSALTCFSQQSMTYKSLGILDSTIIIAENAAKLFLQHGYPNYAVMTLGSIIWTLINEGYYEKANLYMKEYEMKSGLFDDNGNIQKGLEAIYHVKGLLYLKVNRLDSAEYWFRKELRDGKDFNNQNGGDKGLAMLYEKRHVPDSAAKYYRLAYAMNDSMYAQKTTETVERLQSMYDYSRHQELARKESEKAAQVSKRFWIVLSFFLIVCIVACWLYIGRKEIILKLKDMTEDLAEARAEHEELLQDKSANQQTIAENSRRIKQLEKNLGRYGKLVYFGQGKAEADLKISPNYQAMQEMARHGRKLSEEEWAMAEALVNEYFPGCYDFIASKLHSSPIKFRICLLLRLHFINKEVSGMLGYTPAYSSRLSTEIHKDLYGGTGGSKELATNLSKIF